jgi:hypothetical protein
MQTSLLAIAKKAQDLKGYRFLNLYRLIDEKLLLERLARYSEERRLRRRPSERTGVRTEPGF